MIRTKRVYEPAAKVKKEASKIDLWMKDVAPSDALRKSFHHDAMKWSDFEKKYQGELKKKKELFEALKKLEKQHGTITLLYGARDEKHNQAVVLANSLKESG